MSRIYETIQRDEKLRINDAWETQASLPPEAEPIFTLGDAVKILNRIFSYIEEDLGVDKEGWDFSKEKSARDFAGDSVLHLRPFFKEDEQFFAQIRKNRFAFSQNLSDAELIKSGSSYLRKPNALFCLIEKTNDKTKMGYIAVEDTTKNLWEITVFLDEKHRGQGYGAKAISLFLNRLAEITGKHEFQFVAEVDDLPVQGCMRKIGAELVGLKEYDFGTVEDRLRYEQTYQDLITPEMRVLARELCVEPQKLLSHLLDYRIRLTQRL